MSLLENIQNTTKINIVRQLRPFRVLDHFRNEFKNLRSLKI